MINKEQKHQLANMLINNQITIPEFLTLVDGLPILHVAGEPTPDIELYTRIGLNPVIVKMQTQEAKAELLKLINYNSSNKNYTN
jgi:hypothetical protein